MTGGPCPWWFRHDLVWTSDETVDLQALSRKADYRSVDGARMLNSFGASVPQAMNKKHDGHLRTVFLGF
jgi:hypothetical protein